MRSSASRAFHGAKTAEHRRESIGWMGANPREAELRTRRHQAELGDEELLPQASGLKPQASRSARNSRTGLVERARASNTVACVPFDSSVADRPTRRLLQATTDTQDESHDSGGHPRWPASVPVREYSPLPLRIVRFWIRLRRVLACPRAHRERESAFEHELRHELEKGDGMRPQPDPKTLEKINPTTEREKTRDRQRREMPHAPNSTPLDDPAGS